MTLIFNILLITVCYRITEIIYLSAAAGIRHKIGWDLDGMHPAAEAFQTTSRKAKTDWDAIAQKELQRALLKTPQLGVAKNVIVFLGDGLGLPTVTSARFLNAQKNHLVGEDSWLSFEHFPDVGLSQTHTADRIVADSASTATAILCGQKSNFYTVGVNENVLLRNCSNVNDNKLHSIIKYGMDAGKRGGIVTTARITHASPAAAYAHTAYREFEAITPEHWPYREQCPDIASQLVFNEDTQNISVFLGGGLQNFYPIEEDLPGYNSSGSRNDGVNLKKEWISIKETSNLPPESYKFITTKEELENIDVMATDFLLGLFTPSHMSYEVEREVQNPVLEPSFVDMVEKAIQILQKGHEGFVLFAEAGKIDHGHHDNLAHRALVETLMLSQAVEKAMSMTNIEDTLILVTGDHSHSFTLSGYPDIDSDILGKYTSFWEPDDGMPFTPLSYTNGPGFYPHRTDENGTLVYRRNLTDVDTTSDDYVVDAGLAIESETHGGEDVPIYARGPMSFIFQGVHQQHYLAHAMMHAACIGPNVDHCSSTAANLPTVPWIYYLLTFLITKWTYCVFE